MTRFQTTSYSTFYAFFSSFRITLWPMWLANSKRQACFYPPQSHTQEDTQNWQKNWQTWWETCVVPENIQFSFSCSFFFHAVKLNSLAWSVWGPLGCMGPFTLSFHGKAFCCVQFATGVFTWSYWLTYLFTYLRTYLLNYLLTPWSRVVLEKLTGFQSRNSPHFMVAEGSLPHSQMPATCPYPEPARSSPHPQIPLREDPS